MLDLQSVVSNAVKAQRQEQLKTSDQLTLGELIAKLEPIVKRQKGVIEKYHHEAEIRFDFCGLFPTSVSSWRGSYCELALNFEEYDYSDNDKQPLPVSKFLKMLKNTIGKTFTGYKGGEFVMGKNTPIWVDNYGQSTETAIIGVLDREYDVILITAYREF